MKQSIRNQVAAGMSILKDAEPVLTIGLDIGDRKSEYCIREGKKRIVGEGKIETKLSGIAKLAELPPSRIVIEAGAHSMWISERLRRAGHEVIVGNPREIHLIGKSFKKGDRRDAQTLSLIGMVSAELLCPIQHREWEQHEDLLRSRARAGLMESRTGLINMVRGLVKPLGERLASCDAAQVDRTILEHLPETLRVSLEPALLAIEMLSAQIKEYDEQVRKLAEEKYVKETMWLKQVNGVGNHIALTYVLTVGKGERFDESRLLGSYTGLVPKQRASGERAPELSISKAGNGYLRAMLVQSAQYILSRRGEDSDLKRWGLRLAARGKKAAKRRAVVAVARKLAVLLHMLWTKKKVYDPLFHAKQVEAAAKAAA